MIMQFHPGMYQCRINCSKNDDFEENWFYIHGVNFRCLNIKIIIRHLSVDLRGIATISFTSKPGQTFAIISLC